MLGTQQAVWTGVYMDNHVEESIAWSKKNYDIQIIELSEKEKAKWDKLLAPLTDKWIAEANQKGLPGEAIVRDVKAFGAMYAGN